MKQPILAAIVGLCLVQIFRCAYYDKVFQATTTTTVASSLDDLSAYLLQSSLRKSSTTTTTEAALGAAAVSGGATVQKTSIIQGTMHATVLSRPNNNLMSKPPVVDILSIGSKERPFFLSAQRRTMARHYTVRAFVAVTEEDDVEQTCHNLKRSDAKHILEYCRLPKNHTVLPGDQYSVLNQRRKDYTEWKRFVKRKPNPVGWVCAQKRASDGLYKLLQHQYAQNATTSSSSPEALSRLPDYVIIMDDDTFMDLTAVTDYLTKLYDSHEPFVLAGCLLRYSPSSAPNNNNNNNNHDSADTFTIPWGGYSTILSRGALQNLLRPIVCHHHQTNNNNIHDDDLFVENACRRLEQNLFGERRFFEEGMSVAELMYAYTSKSRFSDHKQWTPKAEGGAPAFCVYSDWIWGFFFNYYNIGVHTGSPAYDGIPEERIRSYRLSELFVRQMKNATLSKYKGQCAHTEKGCKEGSHICHMVNTLQMRDYTNQRKEWHPGHYDERPLVQVSDWKAVWTKPEQKGNDINKEKTGMLSQEKAAFRNETARGGHRVFLFPANDFDPFLLDGIQTSSRWQLADHPSLASMWMVDAQRVDCDDLLSAMEAMERDSNKPSRNDWKVVVLDENVIANEHRFSQCLPVMRRIDTTRIYRFQTTSNMVQGRHWDAKLHFVEPGSLIQYGNWRDYSGGPVQHWSCGVPSDTIRGLERILAASSKSSKTSLQVAPNSRIDRQLFERTRATDIALFLPDGSEAQHKEREQSHSNLRKLVRDTLQKHFQQQDEGSNTPPRSVYLGGTNMDSRHDYLQRLLDSKIVVIAHQDDDSSSSSSLLDDNKDCSYQLMESLAAGALVLMDPMLVMPDGLKDGESVVVYHSLEDLVAKVRHYLQADEERRAIAQQGYQIAVTRHRSWHVVERIVEHVVVPSR